eukprot:CAMPEP_0176297658 /NCGR_PEP_ID=MMETSP0121_2-20121125/58838_1 /TAXON_ID=160619 /ORGANISM="Kryptoperidinium foliaceum, Strain CCMP 1326" /LENGTH=605 /DNA_ID=CAMNT_0017638859 /DNA_START=54 /DNA_END=1871 /DNA_ORIENTATION=-
MNLKKREELKDALTDKFKGRFGHGAPKKSIDEMSVASGMIREEVDKFATIADVTPGNLARLERRLEARTRPTGDAASEVSSYSIAHSTMSRTRSVPSMAGAGIVGNQPGAGPKVYNWSKLDEYASYLHEQDCIRQQLGAKALQRKFKMDLDAQVTQKQHRKLAETDEERVYHENQMTELERWKEMEREREEEKQNKIMREKADRDLQLEYERKLKNEEMERKKNEEAQLVSKIVDEMETEQKKFERKKAQQRKSMRKVFEENALDQQKRKQEKQEQMAKEAQAMKDYARAMEEQEEKRQQEMNARIERQNNLMSKLQANVDNKKKNAGDNDAARAAAQQEEMDRHFFEAENVKQNRLKQMRLENQAYLLRQMEEKDMRGQDEKELQNIQAHILSRDSDEYNQTEKEKALNRRKALVEHSKDIKKQMAYKLAQSTPLMSETEIALNKPLLQLVHRTLESAGGPPSAIPEEPEDDATGADAAPAPCCLMTPAAVGLTGMSRPDCGAAASVASGLHSGASPRARTDPPPLRPPRHEAEAALRSALIAALIARMRARASRRRGRDRPRFCLSLRTCPPEARALPTVEPNGRRAKVGTYSSGARVSLPCR